MPRTRRSLAGRIARRGLRLGGAGQAIGADPIRRMDVSETPSTYQTAAPAEALTPDSERVLRQWPRDRIKPATVARCLDSLLAELDAQRDAIRAFVEHHDNGQAGRPGHPKTYAEQDVWLAEWDRRYAALKALVGEAAGTASSEGER